MGNDFKLRRLASAIFILLLALLNFSYPASAKESPILFEMIEEYCSPIGPYCGSVTTRIFNDGRYIKEGDYPEKAKSGQQRKVLFREEKQLEPEEVAELRRLVEQPDFQEAQPEYLVQVVTDIPSKSFTIIFHDKGREKTVKVINLFACAESAKGKIPPSLLKLIKFEGQCYE